MKKVPFQTAQPILKHVELSEEVRDLVDANSAPQTVIELLTAQQAHIDLANFWAHALPMREAIWWAYLAVKRRSDVWSSAELTIIGQVGHWVRSPSEPLRRQIEQAVADLDNACAVKWLGMAVFWSGTGSIAPADNPVVMPAEFLYAKAVSGAINTGAAIPEWQGLKDFYQAVFAIAQDIANGGSGNDNSVRMSS